MYWLWTRSYVAKYLITLMLFEMLLPENINPLNSLYLNGAFVLSALNHVGEAKMLDLFTETRLRKDMPMPLFVLSLDWLFLADLVKFNDHGNLVRCS